MLWLIGILKFIFASIGAFSGLLLIMSIISSIVNPQITLVGNEAIEKGLNARYIMAIISSIAWAIVIALP